MKKELVQSKRGRHEGNSSDNSPSMLNYNQPSTSSTARCHDFLTENDCWLEFANQIVQMDSNLNKCRRMAFTDSRLFDIFSGICVIPFEKHQLRPFDFRSYNGYEKQEYVMMFNYSNALPDFHQLSSTDQNFLFRVVCGVDFVVSSAYYTHCIGIENNLLINQDGTYTAMMPLPLLGDEPGAAALFPQKDEFDKYKNLITPKVKFWKEFQPVFSDMKPTFEENALLKALACWQIAKFKFDEKGKEVSRIQMLRIVRSLLKICQDRYGEEEGAIKTGTIIIFVSLINEKVIDLVSNLIILSFFDIMEGDKLINEILLTSSLFS